MNDLNFFRFKDLTRHEQFRKLANDMIGIEVVLESDPAMGDDYFRTVFHPEYRRMQRLQDIFMRDRDYISRFLLNIT